MNGISVYIPNYNHAKYLGRCLDSILTQSVKPMEVFVLDDASTDNSCDVVRAKQAEYHKSGIPIMLIQYERKSHDWMWALHEHYHEAKGEYIHSMSADDFLLPGAYQYAIEVTKGCGTFIKGWSPGLVMFDWFAVGNDGRSRGIAESGYRVVTYNIPKGDFTLAQLCRPNFYEGGPCALVRKNELLWLHSQEFHKLGSWNDSIGYSVVAWRQGAVYIPRPGGCFTLHDDGNGFNDQEKRDEEKSLAKFRAVWQFMHRPEVVEFCPLKLRTALANKVYRTMSRANQDKWNEQFHKCIGSWDMKCGGEEFVKCNR